MSAAASDSPARGRPRSAEVDAAIIDAALQVLADDGITQFSIESVALRAGVGKATIYRRFAGRDELLAASLDRIRDEIPVAPPGLSAYDQIIHFLDTLRRPCSESSAGRVMAQVIAEAPHHPEVPAAFYSRVIEPRRLRLIGLLRQGIDEGWVRRDLDLESAATLLAGSMLLIKLWHGCGVPEHATTQILDTALRGLGSD